LVAEMARVGAAALTAPVPSQPLPTQSRPHTHTAPRHPHSHTQRGPRQGRTRKAWDRVQPHAARCSKPARDVKMDSWSSLSKPMMSMAPRVATSWRHQGRTGHGGSVWGGGHPQGNNTCHGRVVPPAGLCAEHLRLPPTAATHMPPHRTGLALRQHPNTGQPATHLVLVLDVRQGEAVGHVEVVVLLGLAQMQAGPVLRRHTAAQLDMGEEGGGGGGGGGGAGAGA
jgi:hypothetical protein